MSDNRYQSDDHLTFSQRHGYEPVPEPTLNAMQRPGENWTAKTIESLFRELMFGESDDER